MIYILIIIIFIVFAASAVRLIKSRRKRQRYLSIKEDVRKNRALKSDSEASIYEEFMKKYKHTGNERLIYSAGYLLFNYYKDRDSYSASNMEKAAKTGEFIRKKGRKIRQYNDLLFMLANLYCFKMHEFEKALEIYRELLEFSPSTKWKDLCRDRIYLIEENLPERKVLEHYVTAEQYFENLEFEKAEKYLKNITENYSALNIAGNALYFLGDIYYYKYNKLEEARSYYYSCYTSYPGHHLSRNAMYKAGEVLRKTDRWNEAAGVYKKYIEKFKSTPYVEDAYFFLGECYYNLGKLREAKNSFSLILGDYPESKWTEVIYHKIQEINTKLKGSY